MSKKRNLAFSVPPEEWISDMMSLADNFYEASIELLKTSKFEVLDASGYLASHAAELYLKAYIVSFSGSKKTYDEVASIKHDLNKLLELASKKDKEILKLKNVISTLDKYSGSKIRYPEDRYDPNSPSSFGSDEIWPVRQVRSYVQKKLDW